MGRKPTIQSKLEITSMSSCCDEIVSFEYDKNFKQWRSMCPKCKLNLWIEIKTPTIKYKSFDDKQIKECPNCEKKWMGYHNCNAPDIAAIIQAMENDDMVITV